jgi:hypothetical protein
MPAEDLVHLYDRLSALRVNDFQSALLDLLSDFNTTNFKSSVHEVELTFDTLDAVHAHAEQLKAQGLTVFTAATAAWFYAAHHLSDHRLLAVLLGDDLCSFHHVARNAVEDTCQDCDDCLCQFHAALHSLHMWDCWASRGCTTDLDKTYRVPAIGRPCRGPVCDLNGQPTAKKAKPEANSDDAE